MSEKQTARHTPGPWVFREYAQDPDEIAEAERLGLKPTRVLTNDGAAPVSNGDGERIALVDCQSRFKRGEGWKAECAERDANAYLIAAAPDLLAALEAFVAFEGHVSLGANHPVGRALVLVEAFNAGRAAIAKAKGERP